MIPSWHLRRTFKNLVGQMVKNLAKDCPSSLRARSPEAFPEMLRPGGGCGVCCGKAEGLCHFRLGSTVFQPYAPRGFGPPSKSRSS